MCAPAKCVQARINTHTTTTVASVLISRCWMKLACYWIPNICDPCVKRGQYEKPVRYFRKFLMVFGVDGIYGSIPFGFMILQKIFSKTNWKYELSSRNFGKYMENVEIVGGFNDWAWKLRKLVLIWATHSRSGANINLKYGQKHLRMSVEYFEKSLKYFSHITRLLS